MAKLNLPGRSRPGDRRRAGHFLWLPARSGILSASGIPEKILRALPRPRTLPYPRSLKALPERLPETGLPGEKNLPDLFHFLHLSRPDQSGKNTLISDGLMLDVT
ncbi:MAG: hypothetical protein OXT71_03550, partial [Acidobacteriota bacterium]|nr:hypothetical protein [Acidobacteriota bacterium]